MSNVNEYIDHVELPSPEEQQALFDAMPRDLQIRHSRIWEEHCALHPEARKLFFPKIKDKN